MTRLMTTTAATMIALSTAAYAQDEGPFTQYEVAPEEELIASELMGSQVYAAEGEISGPVESSATSEWNNIGEISDMVLSEDGSVEIVVVGIGGFLGIGAQDAAINMDDLQIVRNGSDMTDYFLVVDATQEQIENAPEFVRNPDDEEAAEGESMDESGETSTSAEEAEQSMESAGEEMSTGAEEAGDEAASEAGQAAEEAGQAAEDAGQAAEDATEN